MDIKRWTKANRHLFIQYGNINRWDTCLCKVCMQITGSSILPVFALSVLLELRAGHDGHSLTEKKAQNLVQAFDGYKALDQSQPPLIHLIWQNQSTGHMSLHVNYILSSVFRLGKIVQYKGSQSQYF